MRRVVRVLARGPVSTATLVVVSSVVLGGCGTPHADGGLRGSAALRPVGSTHALCFSTSTTGRTITEGLDTVANLGPGPVRIDRAEWLNNRGLTLLGISIFQRQDRDRFATFGEWRGFPPKHLVRDGGPTMAAAWARRTPAEGATLPVSDDPGEHYYDIVVSFAGARGSAGPVRLSYTDADGRHGTVDTFVTVTTYPHCPGA